MGLFNTAILKLPSMKKFTMLSSKLTMQPKTEDDANRKVSIFRLSTMKKD